MAVYKLENIASYKMGVFESKRTISQLAVKAYPVISAGVTFKGFYPEYNRDGKYICISVTGASAGFVTIYEGKFWASGDCLTLQLKDKENINWNYFKFLIKKTEKAIAKLGKGSAIKHISWKDIKDMKLTIPTINEQQKIIDIIEPIEKLFIKYKSCVRIDNFKNTKKDVQKIIDIIEPFERLINCIESKKQKIKKMLREIYTLLPKQRICLAKLIKLNSQKKEEQKVYLPTAAVSELGINFKNAINLEKIKKTISRANLTVEPNSIIISKLSGENKLLTIGDWEKQFVYSTGFFNFTSPKISHLLGFFLSNDFKRQKQIFSSGTTMQTITNRAINFIKIKTPRRKAFFDLNCVKILSLINQIINSLEKNKKLLIKLLIKN